MFSLSFLLFFCFKIVFCGGRIQGWWADMEELENKCDWSAGCEIPKELIKNYVNKKE